MKSPGSKPTARQLGAAVFITAAAIFATQVAGRATRDALFLSIFGVARLPVMIMVNAVFSLGMAFLAARATLRWGPSRVLPAVFTISGAVFLIEWGVALVAPPVTAVLLYLHSGALGALLISSFWTALNERLDPRSAKRLLGRVAAAGTLGGLAGGVAGVIGGEAAKAQAQAHVAGAAPVPTIVMMLPALALAHGICALGTRRLRAADSPGRTVEPPNSVTSPGIRALAATPYIRGLLVMVVLVAMGDTLMDLMLKGRVHEAERAGASLLQFFSVFYMGVQLVVFPLQALLSRFVLERVGPARTAALLPAGTAAAALGALVLPGVPGAAVTRGVPAVLMPSLFSSGYEVLFTPVPAQDKRTIKSLVDVGGSRVGDLVGSGLGALIVALALPNQLSLILLALGASVAAFFVAYRLQQGYVDALARGIVSRAVRLDLANATDSLTRSTIWKSLQMTRNPVLGGGGTRESRAGGVGFGRHGSGSDVVESGASPDAADLRARALASHDPDIVRRALVEGPLPPELLPRAVSLLAWDPVAREAVEALRRAGADALDALVEPLLDLDSEFTIRRRVPSVLGTIADPRAVQGLLLSLTDRRFEVRYRSGRALAHLHGLDPSLEVPADIATGAVLREVETSSGVWQGRTLLDRNDDDAWSPVMDELVRDRADRSLEHVFTLLSLVLPQKELRIAFRGLHTDDPQLRGSALEYLEHVLPTEIRRPLWPHLEPERARRGGASSGEEALTQLLRMNDSIVMKLEDMKRRGPAKPG